MLLLVLILVLAAFALLVLALVQGSVLWAWLSVVISVGAASALLFDWWQRQQALRDEEALPPAPTPVPGQHPQAVSADTDAVTEFIPVVSRQGPAPGQSEAETRFLPQEQPTSVEPAVANEQTIVLPIARPPGSGDQPPGAMPSVPPWAGLQSQSVTNPEPPPPVAPAHPTGGRPDPVPVDEETVLQPVDPRTGVGAGPQRMNGAPVGEGNPPPAGDRPPTGGLFAAPVAEDATSAVPAQPPQPVQQPPHEPVRQAPHEPPADEHGEPDATELAMPALPPAGPDGEPPEEPHEPAAATIVAALEDEVVVVDERPRYHVEGCPFLPGRPVIPLPAREAVELGFTPCGWCRPNRRLSERHPAAAR